MPVTRHTEQCGPDDEAAWLPRDRGPPQHRGHRAPVFQRLRQYELPRTKRSYRIHYYI